MGCPGCARYFQTFAVHCRDQTRPYGDSKSFFVKVVLMVSPNLQRLRYEEKRNKLGAIEPHIIFLRSEIDKPLDQKWSRVHHTKTKDSKRSRQQK
ncbi:hypothetical protein Mapa_009860 [Marchantia paleacea]|nr:hypothetical protein Mapa_009860 [Marchantia paleacea]